MPLHKLWTGRRMFRILVAIVLVTAFMASLAGVVLAQGGAYAFGYKWITSVRGHRVWIWTGQRPNGQTWTASPVVICQNQYCSRSNGWVETGWVDGTAWDLGDVLQQYVTYANSSGVFVQELHKGNLANDTWYQFKVLYSNSAARWEAWRGNDVVWFQPHSLGWTVGSATAYGSEAANSQDWMDVYGYYPEYKDGLNPWTSFIHSIVDPLKPQIGGGGCITRIYSDQGYRAYGPTSTCTF